MMLNFLTRLPNKYLMLFIFLVIFLPYLYFQTDFLASLSREVLIGLIALLGVHKGIEVGRKWQKEDTSKSLDWQKDNNSKSLDLRKSKENGNDSN